MGVFDFAQSLAGDVKVTVQAALGAIAVLFIAVTAWKTKMAAAAIIVSILVAALLIAGVTNLSVVTGWMQTEIK